MPESERFFSSQPQENPPSLPAATDEVERERIFELARVKELYSLAHDVALLVPDLYKDDCLKEISLAYVLGGEVDKAKDTAQEISDVSIKRTALNALSDQGLDKEVTSEQDLAESYLKALIEESLAKEKLEDAFNQITALTDYDKAHPYYIQLCELYIAKDALEQAEHVADFMQRNEKERTEKSDNDLTSRETAGDIYLRLGERALELDEHEQARRFFGKAVRPQDLTGGYSTAKRMLDLCNLAAKVNNPRSASVGYTLAAIHAETNYKAQHSKPYNLPEFFSRLYVDPLKAGCIPESEENFQRLYSLFSNPRTKCEFLLRIMDDLRVEGLDEEYKKIEALYESEKSQSEEASHVALLEVALSKQDTTTALRELTYFAQNDSQYQLLGRVTALVAEQLMDAGNVEGYEKLKELNISSFYPEAESKYIEYLFEKKEDELAAAAIDKYLRTSTPNRYGAPFVPIIKVAYAHGLLDNVVHLVQGKNFSNNDKRIDILRSLEMVLGEEGQHERAAQILQLALNARWEGRDGGSYGNQVRALSKYVVKNMCSDALKLTASLEGYTPDYERIRSLLSSEEPDKELISAVGAIGNKEDISTVLGPLQEKTRAISEALIDSAALRFNTEFSQNNRLEITRRNKDRLEEAMSDPNTDTKQLVKLLANNLRELNTKETKDTILSLARNEAEKADLQNLKDGNPHFLRLLKTLAEINTFRGNDLVLSVAADSQLPHKYSRYLLGKLIANGYLDESIARWDSARHRQRRERPNDEEKVLSEHQDLAAIKQILRHGIIPSADILNYLVPKEWKTEDIDKTAEIEQRLTEIQGYKEEFASTPGNNELAKILEDDDKALGYYVLNNSKTRFDLINNYDFKKFQSLIQTINSLEVAQEPIDRFKDSLGKTGLNEDQVLEIEKNLKLGKYPFSGTLKSEKTIRLDISDNTRLESANNEVAEVLGSQQVGVCLKTPLYREYFSKLEHSENSLVEKLEATTTLDQRAVIIEEIEKQHPEFLLQATADLSENWKLLGEKVLFNVEIENILTQQANPINTEEMIRIIEEKRLTLKNAKRELLASLKMENPQVKRLSSEIRKKQKALNVLRKGLEQNPGLEGKIQEITQQITDAENRLNELSRSSISNRYAELSEEEREKAVEEETRVLAALSEKDPSAIFLYLILETLGDKNITENDANLLREVSSHLEGPFQLVADLAKLDPSGRKTREEKPVKVRYLDKKDDFMTMVRFADSKICCFSSSNYSMRVAHNTPNEQWVASINKDPLSFVFSIESASPTANVHETQENLGFVFGMFGVTEENTPAVLLNGVYLSTGNDEQSTKNILNTIEELLSIPIGADYQIVATKHGGGISGELKDYSTAPIEVTRLRGLKGFQNQPETKVYDDLGTTVNTKQVFSNDARHKKLK